MEPKRTIANRILGIVRETPYCTVEDLFSNLPNTPWSLIFLQVEHLHRLGQLMVTSRGIIRLRTV